MNTFRLASSLFVSALLLVACGDDKGDTDNTTTLTDPTNTTPPTTMTMGTTIEDPTTGPGDTTVDPDTGPGDTTVDPTNTTPPGPTTTTDPTEDPTAGGDGMFCIDQCAADGDCTIMGMDLGFTCQDGTCQGESSGCTDDAYCTAMFSGWVTDCVDQTPCMALGQACIDIGGGVGKCATQPSDFLTCEQIMQTELMLPLIDGSMDVAVCGNTDFTCNTDTGACENPCDDDMECANFPGHPTCDTGSGQCKCASDADCTGSGVPGYAVCTASGTCGCGTNDDCTGTNQDTCYDGLCGCSNSDVCTMPVFDGTTQECKSF